MASDKVTGPLGPRRSIATALKQLREDTGKNLNEVAGDLMISTSKLSRMENAQGRPLPRDIKDVITYYGIEGRPYGTLAFLVALSTLALVRAVLPTASAGGLCMR